MLGWLFVRTDALELHRATVDNLNAVIAAIPPRYKREYAEPPAVLVRRIIADADGEKIDHHETQVALCAARDDIQALNARLVDVEKRAAKAAELFYAEQEAHRRTRERLQAEDRRAENDQLWAEWDAVESENDRLKTLIGNARNQLDGRAHHPVTSIEIAECCGA